MNRLFLVYVLLLCGLWFMPPPAFAAEIVANGRAEAVIYHASDPQPAERLAVEELNKFMEQATGARLKTTTELEPSHQDVIVVGRNVAGSPIRRLVNKGHMAWPDNLGGDGFVMRTLESDNRRYLVLGGARGRAVLYAVYEFLERVVDVGFFWEGDIVPTHRSVRVSGLDVVEQPYHEIRMYLQECIFAYNTRPWTKADWRAGLDWAVKRRINQIMVPEEQWNLVVPQEEIVEMAQARDLELVFAVQGFWKVSNQFRKDNPDHEYVRMRWIGASPYWTLHPNDPLFIKRGQAAIREITEKYGSGHTYWISPYGEQSILGASSDEVRRIRMSFPGSVVRVIRSEDAEGEWTFWTWPFTSRGWSQKEVRDFMSAVPRENAYVLDASPVFKRESSPYREYNYYEQRPWLLSVIHVYGGDDYLFGNLQKMIDDVQALVDDPKAGQWRGMYLAPEMINFNHLYFDLFAEMMWDPRGVELSAFLEHYAQRRYGREHAPRMLEALRHVVQAVYDENGGMEPLYHRRLSRHGFLSFYLTEHAEKLAAAPRQAAQLRKALQIMLREADQLRNNPAFQRDLVDFGKEYITNLVNRYFTEAMQAFGRGDEARFDRAVARIEALLDGLERILAAYPPRQIRPLLERLEGVSDYDRKARVVKDLMFTFANADWVRDYASKDMFELLRFYYRPRLQHYFKAHKEAMQTEDKGIGNLSKKYRKIEQAWVAKDLNNLPEDIYRDENVIDVAAEVLPEVISSNRSAERRIGVTADWIVKRGAEAVLDTSWSVDFSSMEAWRRTHFEGGSFSTDGEVAMLSPPADGSIVFGRDLDLPIDEHPILGFTFRDNQDGDSGKNSFTLWITWEDASGQRWRNRIYQRELIPFGKWHRVHINLEAVLSSLSTPARIIRIEIQNSARPVQWKSIEFGHVRN